MTRAAQDDSDFIHHINREFELKFLKTRGEAFQDFFSEIMESAYPSDFQRIRPHGNAGDLKCDGYLESAKTVFQVYGPEEIRSLNKLLTKMDQDFRGALASWSERMAKWVFLHNSRKGLPAQAIQKLEDFRNMNEKILVESWGYEELWQVLVNISPGRLALLFPGPKRTNTGFRLSLLPDWSTRERYWSWLDSRLHELESAGAFKESFSRDLPIRLSSRTQVEEFARTDERRSVSDAQSHWQTRSDDGWGTLFKGHITIAGLQAVLRKHPRILIEGEAGAGKTTLLQRFAIQEAGYLLRRGVARRKRGRKTPLLVDLSRFAPGRSLQELLITSIGRSGIDISVERFRLLAAQGYFVFLLDGLDEVSGEDRRQCLREIMDLADENSRCSLLVTTRPFPEPLLNFHKLALTPLGDLDIAEALRARYGSIRAFRQKFDGMAPEDYVHLHIRADLRRLCRLPLTLRMVITLLQKEEELPSSLFAVYGRFVSWLFDWEDRNERLPSLAACMTASEQLAGILLKQESSSASLLDWTEAVAGALGRLRDKQVIGTVDAETVTRTILATGLVVNSWGEVTFTHKGYRDFFSARHILGDSVAPQDNPHSLHHDIFRFLCGGLDDVTELLEKHLANCRDVNELFPLLNECSLAHCTGGRFEDLYSAIILARDMEIETNFLRGPKAERFIDTIDKLAQTCVVFKPKALGVLKGAAWGIIMGTPWEQSRAWFERIVTGLEDYGWQGAEHHRRLINAGFFERLELFSYEDESQSEAANYEALGEYLKALEIDDFDRASWHLRTILKALGVEDNVREKDPNQAVFPFHAPESEGTD